MRLALIQERAVRNDPVANLATGVEACLRAQAMGADLVLFPEMWQIGYGACPEPPAARAAWLARAEDVTGPWMATFERLAAATGMAIVTTFLRRTDTGYRNAAAVIDATGALVLVHDKVHICDFDWESVLEPGTSFEVANVATPAGTVRVGVMTCFDREFPESARALALGGAELILSPNACLICDDRLAQLRCRAFENMAAVALANYPYPYMNGRSCAFDGIAIGSNRPRDHQLLVADAKPGTHVIDIDIDSLRRYRADGLWSQARRRPLAYQLLTADVPVAGGM